MRYSNLRIISQKVSQILAIFGIFTLFPAIIAIMYSEGSSVSAYIFSFIIIELIALSLYWFSKKHKLRKSISRNEVLTVVSISWIFIGLLGAIPFLLDEVIKQPIDAIFESVSGFTTTGSTILTDIESLTYASLLWRSLLQWLGGLAIIILFVAVIQQSAVSSKQLFKSEVSALSSKAVKPRIKETSRFLVFIYSILTFLLFLILLITEMKWFDALCHSLSTISTGGFSTKNANISFYDSALIESILIIFMVISSINYVLYYRLLKDRKDGFFKDGELRVFLLLTAFIASIVIFIHFEMDQSNLFDSIRIGLFQVVSLISTNGFRVEDQLVYPISAQFLFLFIMLIGACAGSASGGLKVSRLIIGFKAAFFDVYKNYQPQHIKTLKIDQMVVNNDVVRAVLSLVFLYFITLLITTMVIAGQGYGLMAAFSSVLTSLSNVGPAFDAQGSLIAFSDFNQLIKFLLTSCMLIGRLEFYLIFVLFIPSFWRR